MMTLAHTPRRAKRRSLRLNKRKHVSIVQNSKVVPVITIKIFTGKKLTGADTLIAASTKGCKALQTQTCTLKHADTPNLPHPGHKTLSQLFLSHINVRKLLEKPEYRQFYYIP